MLNAEAKSIKGHPYAMNAMTRVSHQKWGHALKPPTNFLPLCNLRRHGRGQPMRWCHHQVRSKRRRPWLKLVCVPVSESRHAMLHPTASSNVNDVSQFNMVSDVRAVETTAAYYSTYFLRTDDGHANYLIWDSCSLALLFPSSLLSMTLYIQSFYCFIISLL